MDSQAPGFRSLGMRTEAAVAKWGCELTRRDGYWVMRTPDNPDYWFGNSLIFDAPPGAQDFDRWMTLFAQELGPESKHRVFQIDGVDGDEGDGTPFLAAGFELERTHVLSATRVVAPPKMSSRIDVRPVSGDRVWAAVLALALDVAVHDEGLEDTEAQREFLRRRLQTHRTMQERGLGQVWGAFIEGKLVGKLGLFHVGELSRFQAVATSRDHRREGICGTLVHEVCTRALAERPGRRLVMCAFEDYHATHIYQSLGFSVTELHVDYVRRPSVA